MLTQSGHQKIMKIWTNISIWSNSMEMGNLISRIDTRILWCILHTYFTPFCCIPTMSSICDEKDTREHMKNNTHTYMAEACIRQNTHGIFCLKCESVLTRPYCSGSYINASYVLCSAHICTIMCSRWIWVNRKLGPVLKGGELRRNMMVSDTKPISHTFTLFLHEKHKQLISGQRNAFKMFCVYNKRFIMFCFVHIKCLQVN